MYVEYLTDTKPNIANLKPELIEPFCNLIIDSLAEAFRKEENRKKFEAWYREKYGKEYVWQYYEPKFLLDENEEQEAECKRKLILEKVRGKNR